MGSGRVGSMVAAALDERGHSVAVIDINSQAFRKLPEGFSGQRIKGIGFDRTVLKKAGIDEAYGFAAVSNGDNTNIIAARVARETFGVKHVVARILDPRRAEVYERLGIQTIGTATWSSVQILERILPDRSEAVYTDSQLGVCLARIRPHNAWIGTAVHHLRERLGCEVAYIDRQGRALLDLDALAIQPDDVLFVLTHKDRLADVRYALTRVPDTKE